MPSLKEVATGERMRRAYPHKKRHPRHKRKQDRSEYQMYLKHQTHRQIIGHALKRCVSKTKGHNCFVFNRMADSR